VGASWTGSAPSLAANVAVAEPTAIGWVIAAWPSFALICAYGMLMRQVRRSASGAARLQQAKPRPQVSAREAAGVAVRRSLSRSSGWRSGGERVGSDSGRGRDLKWQAWQWALANWSGDGSLPSGREIARQYARHERWGRLVKHSGAAGELAPGGEPTEAGLRLVEDSANFALARSLWLALFHK
jgi:hypothetical protein